MQLAMTGISTTSIMHCYVCNATLVRRKLHNVTLYVHCLYCCIWHISLARVTGVHTIFFSICTCLEYYLQTAYCYFTIVWPCIITASLWIKPTDTLNANFIGITTLQVSGSLSAHPQEFLAVHRLWYIFCSCDEPLLPGVGWSSILLLVATVHQGCPKHVG